ncbi:zinc finger FYVE domain-containing protein 26 homolog [Cylas formicarius]|uniref:zinc finger FYVE domain-containing protein 26 homolog n=1 Tax=Cylas formicarius TaxID=197179 RepID=UPI0029583D49|nr:zinc finger FYVE domain-containing protein 26 homolog [Cylas formicarius]
MVDNFCDHEKYNSNKMKNSLEKILEGNLSFLNEFYQEICEWEADEYCSEDFILNTWTSAQAGLLEWDKLYRSLVVSRNANLLNMFMKLSKRKFHLVPSDAYSLYDFTVFFKKHWLKEVIDNYDYNDVFPVKVMDKIGCLKLIQTSNRLNYDFSSSNLRAILNKVKLSNLDEFFIFYVKEVRCLLEVVDYCKNLDPNLLESRIFEFSSRHSMLDVLSHYLDIEQINSEQMLAEFDICNELLDYDINDQKKELFCFSILTAMFNIITYSGNVKEAVNHRLNEIKTRLLQIENKDLQLEMLENIFAMIFLTKQCIKTSDWDKCDETEFQICHENEVRIVLFLVKSVIDVLQLQKVYSKAQLEQVQRFKDFNKCVSDAMWRFQLISKLDKKTKKGKGFLNYLLAPPESLIYMCLKKGNIEGAYQVLKIFNLESSFISNELDFTSELQNLKADLRKVSKMKSIQKSNTEAPNMIIKAEIDEIVLKFFSTFPIIHYESSEEATEIEDADLQRDQKLFMNVFDLSFTYLQNPEDSLILLQLASNFNTVSNESRYGNFTKSIFQLCSELCIKLHLTLPQILSKSNIPLDIDNYRKNDSLGKSLMEAIDQFTNNLAINESGDFNSNHPSHKSLLNLNGICNEIVEKPDNIKYLQKFYNYLKAFSKILYIDKDCSDIVSKGRNTSFFELLAHNRSELMGKLLFERDLDPSEFERYFKLLKLDYLYHITGNCFPTVNLYFHEDISQEELYPENRLYLPSEAVITYIQKRNWFLAFILKEMCRIENVEIEVDTRISTFLNYLKLPKIRYLKAIFNHNDILASLQRCISYQTLTEYINKQIGKCDVTSLNGSPLNSSFEVGKEILEEDIHIDTDWDVLCGLVDIISENHFGNFDDLSDRVLINLLNYTSEPQYLRYIMNIHDVNKRIDLIMENIGNWPLNFSIKCLKCELSRFQSNFTFDQIGKIKTSCNQVSFYKKIMDLLHLGTWVDVFQLCTQDPVQVIKRLLEIRKIECLIEFIELHPLDEAVLHNITECDVHSLFTSDVEYNLIESFLNKLPLQHTHNLGCKLLSSLNNLKHIEFLVKYLASNVEDEWLQNVKISLKMLSAFPSNELDPFFHLLGDPLAIIEVLIMNTKLEKLNGVLKVIKPVIQNQEYKASNISAEKIDELIRFYAEKSLDFNVVLNSLPHKLRKFSENKLMQSLDSLLDESLNKGFVMPDEVPSKSEWVEDNAVIECMCCSNITFSMFNRRHHCRRCGRVICYTCSSKRMMVPTYGDILVKVCSDCYAQTYRIESEVSETVSSKSLPADIWTLTSDPQYNKIVREEFSYEHTPNVFLCLSLMKFHSMCEEYPKFLLEKCENILQLLYSWQEAVKEIDHALIIKMLKLMAIAVKMSSHDCNLQLGSSLVNKIISQADLLDLLAKRGCMNLLPTSKNSPYIDALAIRKLRDKLLEKEQWNLALEVSTKAGLETTGVFVAWGKSCMKAGSLLLAREKFGKCLDKAVLDGGRESSFSELEKSSASEYKRTKKDSITLYDKPLKNPPLLNEIVKILESKTELLNECVLKQCGSKRGASFSSQPETPLFILTKLNNLQNVANGKYSEKKPHRLQTSNKPAIDDFLYNECLYYLNRYGSHLSIVEFHIRHGHFEEALNYIVSCKLGPDIFAEIYTRCLKDGVVEILQTNMSKIDSSLELWKEHLNHICFYLEKQNMLNSLYQLQLYMGDYMRAAVSCIRFYESDSNRFLDLQQNAGFLKRAENHLKQVLEQEQWVNVTPEFEEKSILNPTLVMKIDVKDVHRHIRTIRIENVVVNFLANCETCNISSPMKLLSKLRPSPDKDSTHSKKSNIPTLFGSNLEKKHLTCLCIVCGKTIREGFDIALRIIKEFKLNPVRVYNESGKLLAQVGRYGDIAELVTCIKETETNNEIVLDMCDEMLTLAVSTLTKSNVAGTEVENLIKLISDKTSKISAYIEAKQLKTAYFLAVKYKRISDVRRILREAELTNQANIKTLCHKFLQSFSHSTDSASEN